MSKSPKSAYEKRYRDVLVPVAKHLQVLLESHFKGIPRIDRISVRAKSPVRFLEKAKKKEDDGSPSYKDPLGEIQDQIGGRIIVFYTRDIKPVCRRVRRYFRHIEQTRIEPESEAEFGYVGDHFILSLPEDAIPKGIAVDDAPRVFELQVKTLFQHAWSEAEHDIGYKSPSDLTTDQNRRFAFTAAQAWGADLIFDALYEELKEG